MPSGSPFSCAASGNEIAGMPQRLASGARTKLRHRLPNQSSTDGLSLIVRYSEVPTFGVGSAVIGVNIPVLKECAEATRSRVEDRLHVRSLGKCRVPAGLPDPYVDRFDKIRRWPLEPARGEQVADDLGEIADVAGSLRREGGAIIDVRQDVIHVMAEVFEKPAHSFEFRRNVGCRAIVAPLVRERDSEPARIVRDELCVKLWRGPERHEFAGRGTSAGVDESGGVAHGTRLTRACQGFFGSTWRGLHWSLPASPTIP